MEREVRELLLEIIGLTVSASQQLKENIVACVMNKDAIAKIDTVHYRVAKFYSKYGGPADFKILTTEGFPSELQKRRMAKSCAKYVKELIDKLEKIEGNYYVSLKEGDIFELPQEEHECSCGKKH